MDIKQLFIAGGVVMWPLLLSSIIAVGLIIERIWFWSKITKRQEKVVKYVLNLYRQNNLVNAIDTLQKNADLPIARIFFDCFRTRRTQPGGISFGLRN